MWLDNEKKSAVVANGYLASIPPSSIVTSFDSATEFLYQQKEGGRGVSEICYLISVYNDVALKLTLDVR